MVILLAAAAGCASVSQSPSPISGPSPSDVERPAAPSGARTAAGGIPPSATAPRAPAGAQAAPIESSPQVVLSPPQFSTPQPANAAAPQFAPPADLPQVVGGKVPVVQEGSLWDRIRAGFAMPELDTPLVAEKERFYLQKPEYLERMLLRSSRYLFHIVEEVEKRGLPTELALLPFVESAMNPVALSSAKAAGLWQFIPSTGKAYNLNQNWWVDNRRDVVESTRAALDYLEKIHAMHGNDWFLALASYNWGEGAVARAVKANQARGRPTDYLSLKMPAETRHYVPKLIALKHILQRSSEVGVNLPSLPNRPYFVTIEKTRPIDLKLAAQFAGMTVEEFVALNPAHNRPVISASRNNEIKLPAERVEAFIEAVERHGEANKVFATWQPHTMKAGETLESLASRGNTTVAEIQKANGLRAGSRIVAGTRILVPHKSVDDETRVESFVAPRVYEQVDIPPGYHVVGKRDSLPGIASRYGLAVSTLQGWNGGVRKASRGMRLLVRPASTQTLLTAENGARTVVASTNRAPVMSAVLPVLEEEPVQRKAATAVESRSKTACRTVHRKRVCAPVAEAGRTPKVEPARRVVHRDPPRATKLRPAPAHRADFRQRVREAEAPRRPRT